VPSDSCIPPSPVTTSNNSFSVLTIEEPRVEEDTVEMEGEGVRTPSVFDKSEGAVSPSDSKRRGKKSRKPEREKAEWRRLPLGSAHQVALPIECKLSFSSLFGPLVSNICIPRSYRTACCFNRLTRDSMAKVFGCRAWNMGSLAKLV
jgi:hypothetical protein